MDYIEKRIFRRLDAELPVEVKLEGNSLNATTSNISCGGMFLRVSPVQVPERKQIDVFIHLPTRSKPVQLSGEILRSESNQRNGIAVQFKGLYNDNFLEIEKFIKGRMH